MSTRPAVQSAILKSFANIVAQLAARWHEPVPQPLDWQRVLEFAVFGLIQAQLNTYWQHLLEDIFPTRHQHSNRLNQHDFSELPSQLTSTTGICWRNVISKLILDQTVGLFIMNTTFLVCVNAVRLQSTALVYHAVRDRIFGVIRTAWKLWPWVSMANFLWVPVDKRVLVASCVGFGWNVFLAFSVMTK